MATIKINIITLILFIGFGQTFAQNTPYFPPVSGNSWDTLPPDSLNWCQPKIDSLYTFLDSIDTKSFIVLKDGKIVLEKYFNTYTIDSTFSWYSAAKSFRAVLVGKAQEEGFFDINDTTSNYLGSGWSSLSQAQEDSILIKHQISMTTGLDETNFLCVVPSCLNYVAPAGSRWAYHNGPYSLTKNILETTTGMTNNAYSNLLENQIGMNGFWLSFLGNSSYYSTGRDMARFGLLVSNNCIWNNDTIIKDTAYLNQMLTSSQSLNPAYGYLWWLNGQSHYISPSSPIIIPGSISPDAPSDIYVAAGSYGQFISISNSTGLIMVRQGLSDTGNYTEFGMHNEIWKKIMKLSCPPLSVTSNNKEQSIKFYPNPANNLLHFDMKNRSKTDITIYDSYGRIILTRTIENQTQLDISYLTPGMYFIKIADLATMTRFIKY